MKISKFQIIVLGAFIIFLVVGVYFFANFKGSGGTQVLAPITVWGTIPSDVFNRYVANVNQAAGTQMAITYVQESPSSFTSDFVSALARGKGPDAVLIPSELILANQDKFAPIPFTALSQRTFMDTYIKEANIYIGKDGFYGLPFLVDPLVMYWNRDMLDTAGIATYPRTWSDVDSLNSRVTLRDANGNIRRSAVALGQFGNIDNAREILGTLLLQSGNPVTSVNADGNIASTIKVNAAANPVPAISYFTNFANPTNASYSWNRSMPSSKTAFLSGMLATYFGFASELADIKAKNPNLNFDVAMMPQVKSGGFAATYGRLYGFSLVRTSPNVNTAYQIFAALSAPQYMYDLSLKLYMPSVRRDVINAGSNDPYLALFNKSALIASTWLDIDPTSSGTILGNMVEYIANGQKTVEQAVGDAGDQFDALLRQALDTGQ